jgi:hypothetical protein
MQQQSMTGVLAWDLLGYKGAQGTLLQTWRILCIYWTIFSLLMILSWVLLSQSIHRCYLCWWQCSGHSTDVCSLICKLPWWSSPPYPSSARLISAHCCSCDLSLLANNMPDIFSSILMRPSFCVYYQRQMSAIWSQGLFTLTHCQQWLGFHASVRRVHHGGNGFNLWRFVV